MSDETTPQIEGSTSHRLLAVLAYHAEGRQLLAIPPDCFAGTCHRDIARSLHGFWRQHKRPPGAHFIELFAKQLADEKDGGLYEQQIEIIDRVAGEIVPTHVVATASEFWRRQTIIHAIRRAHIEIDGDSREGESVLEEALRTARAIGTPAQSHRFWMDDVDTSAPASDYLAKNLLSRRDLLLIYGPSGCGKTFFAIDMAARIASGVPWRGRRVKSGLVVYVGAEAGASITRRFRAWRDQAATDGLIKRDDFIPLAILTRGTNLLDAKTVSALMAELEAIAEEAGLPLALVVFDTLSRSIPGGDENSAEDMTAAIGVADRIRDELGAAVAFVHHSGKDASKGARGHSALHAAADTVLSVAEGVATVEKVRDGVAGERFGFSLRVADLGTDDDGDRVTTCVAVAADVPSGKSRGGKLSGAAQVGLDALNEAMAESSRLVNDPIAPEGIKVVAVAKWRERFRVRYGADDPEALKSAFRRAREALLKAGTVRLAGDWVWPI